MPHTNLADILRNAQRFQYGVPNLWAGNLDMVCGYIAAAEAARAPICICVNHVLGPGIPVSLNASLIVKAAEEAAVPVATVLDHGADLDACVQCIRHGISSVMFDGSRLPYDENVRQTLDIVEVAHEKGVSVEAELGAVGGSALETGEGGTIKSSMTDPDQAAEFAARTRIDALAVSFGNCHGSYRGEPNLDLELLRRIREKVSVPLVMHGASGLKDSLYPGLIHCGISKINYYTAMSLSGMANVRSRIRENPQCGFHDLVRWNREFFRQDTFRLLELFGCKGRADRSA